MMCEDNSCEQPRCHRCFPVLACTKHEKCREMQGTVECRGGREISVNGRAFVYLSRSEGGAGPVEADAFAHYLAQKIDWKEFVEFLERYKKS